MPVAMPKPVGIATTSPNTLVERMTFHRVNSRPLFHCRESETVFTDLSDGSGLDKCP